jgi:hypothetical protein
VKLFFVRRVEAPSSLPQLKASSKLDHYHSTIKRLTFNISAGQAHITTQQSGVLNSAGCPPRCEKAQRKLNLVIRRLRGRDVSAKGKLGYGRIPPHPTPHLNPSQSISLLTRPNCFFHNQQSSACFPRLSSQSTGALLGSKLWPESTTLARRLLLLLRWHTRT